MRRSLAIALLTLAACGQPADSSQRITLDDTPHGAEVPLPSPDTEGAEWAVSESGQAISLGKTGEPALLTLECHLGDEAPQLAIIRHAPALPGLQALFPVQGNGMRSRFAVDAVLAGDEWRWEGTLPAEDPAWEVFTGPRELTATMPGRGMLEIEGSRLPGEFIEWCRKGGAVLEVEEEEEAAEG